MQRQIERDTTEGARKARERSPSPGTNLIRVGEKSMQQDDNTANESRQKRMTARTARSSQSGNQETPEISPSDQLQDSSGESLSGSKTIVKGDIPGL